MPRTSRQSAKFLIPLWVWMYGKSFEIWHAGWKFGKSVKNRTAAVHGQARHLQSFSKWQLYCAVLSSKCKTGDIWRFIAYHFQIGAPTYLQVVEPLQWAREVVLCSEWVKFECEFFNPWCNSFLKPLVDITSALWSESIWILSFFTPMPECIFRMWSTLM